MWEELVVLHCSPTLAGMKTGSMFSCPVSSEEKMKEKIRDLNHIIVKKGLRALPLRLKDGKALIYIYRPKHLTQDLKNVTASKLLQDRGYSYENPDRCVVQLIRKLQESLSFPHEIGLFLGYPPEDVCGFINDGPDCCKCVGCWKVYGDENNARELFRKYKKCTDVYCACHAKGRSIEHLTVAS